MNIALSTSKIVICYSPQTQQSAFRSFASQKRTTTHSTVYTITNGLPFHELQHLHNYKGPSLSPTATRHSLSTPTTKQSIPFPLFTLHRPFRTLDICPFATVCFRTDQIFTSPTSSTSAISRTFSVRFLQLHMHTRTQTAEQINHTPHA